MKIGIVGSRSFFDYDSMCAILGVLDITEIISGGAEGADRLAERYAIEKDIKATIFPALWDKFPGKTASYERNKMIVSEADSIVAFWDGASKGTRMTMRLCWESKKPLIIVRTDMLNKGDSDV